jgi:hypothetical protein
VTVASGDSPNTLDHKRLKEKKENNISVPLDEKDISETNEGKKKRRWHYAGSDTDSSEAPHRRGLTIDLLRDMGVSC